MKITNNEFVGVKWEAKSLKTVEMVAESILNMTRVLISQNIEIECLLKIEGDTIEESND